MFLRDHFVLNLLRRLRGWKVGRVRLMVEARDGMQHFFTVYEARGVSRTEAVAHVEAELADQGLTFIEIAEEKPAKVPMPRAVTVIRLSDRIYFGDMPGAISEVPRQAVRPE